MSVERDAVRTMTVQVLSVASRAFATNSHDIFNIVSGWVVFEYGVEFCLHLCHAQ